MHLRKYLVISASAAALVLAASSGLARAGGPHEPNGKVPGQYIVVLKDGAGDSASVAAEMAAANGLGILHVYGHALRGFAASVPEGRLARIEHDPRVAFVSEDRLVSADGKPGSGSTQPPPQAVPTGVNRIGALADPGKGAGVGVAVLDTGIDLTHPDLKDNIIASKNCLSTRKSATDDNGHGSHVAGTIAAADNAIGVIGVAPRAKLAAVKVLNSQGSGTWSSIICGLDWVTANAAALNLKVVNMSLSGGGSSDDNCGLTNGDALHQAVCRVRDAGVTVVVAAGNSGASAMMEVPAAYDDAVITVSALADSDGSAGGLGAATAYGADDTFASFSNYGSVVDIGAPGVNIRSAWKGGSYATISGTSMASPHVAGAAALYLAGHPGADWLQVRDGLRAAAEPVGAGHTDPSGLHPEPVLKAGAL